MKDFKIKLTKSTFLNEQETKRKLCNFIMKAKILSMSEQCRLFEENFAKKQERKFAVFVNSGSSANLILIQALLNIRRLKKGDRIGVSAVTWSTNVMPIIELGLEPVVLDVELNTINVSSRNLLKRINGLRGLFLTNALGFCDDIDNIRKICARKKIVFLEDNCESLGSRAYKKLLGNFGLASTFSFFLGHHLSTNEGGMICTDDEDLYNMLVIARAHGWDRNLPVSVQKRLRGKHNIDAFFGKYTFYDLAYNVRPTEINGFIGNVQLKYLSDIVRRRRTNFSLFQKSVMANDDFIPLSVGHMDVVSNFAMPLLCRNHPLFEKYKKRFEDNGIEIRPIIAGNINKQPFFKKYVRVDHKCPNADLFHRNGFYFPNNPELNEKEVNLLNSLLKSK